MNVSYIELESCTSTSAALTAMSDAGHGTVVFTNCQTAGRGQRGNSWEAEPGKNLTFSLLIRPEIAAARQFELSMIVALSVARIIDSELAAAGCPERTKVKWPNDIYVGDNKICGILIENRLSGAFIERSIAGIGINVNQTLFRSDAPNPISLSLITGRHYELTPLLERVCAAIYSDCYHYHRTPDPEGLKARYMASLYRGDGAEYMFCEPGGEPFAAAITDIDITGMLTLSNGRTYAFKEVAYII